MTVHTLHTPSILHTSAILHEVRTRRNNENLTNAFKLIGILCLALFAAWIAMLLAAPARFAETSSIIAVSLLMFIDVMVSVVCLFLSFCWPFLLYFWANVQRVRQRTLLTLIQTAVETGRPLQDIVRAYAISCFPWYAVRLQRFADTLDSGHSLEAAVRHHWGLFRYDIAGMVRLGSNAAETLRSIDNVAREERNAAPIRSITIIRVIYFCALFFWPIPIITFFAIKIVPEFKRMFAEFGDLPLPLITTLVFGIMDYFATFWYLSYPLILLFALMILLHLILQTNVVVFRPVCLRRIFRNTDAAKFLMLFAVGMQQRYPIPVILQMYRWTVPSDYLRKRGTYIQKAVEQGEDWIDAVHRSGFIERAEASLLQSAQRTGNTAAVLSQLAQTKERTQIRKDDLFSKMVFIPLIFLFAAFIGTFVLAMFLPLLELVTALAG